MAKRDKDMTLYSQSNVIASYISMIKFSIEKIELYIDEIGDEVFFDLDESIFPPDVLGDDTLFAGYTNPWSPDDKINVSPKLCMCDKCWDEAAVKHNRMSTGSIMDMLKKTRKVPQDYRMD